MILRHADDPVAFRAALRAWLADVLPADWRRRLAAEPEAAHVDFQRWWFAQRRGAGLILPGLPQEFGGAELGFAAEEIMVEEFARAGAPSLEGGLYMVSLTHVPATLLAWGTADQKTKHLPGLMAGDIWCQGFSEPGAGSDLAALRTRAVRDGETYVVNGQKVWSSWSRHAKYCLLLVRTDPAAPRHKGVSYLILDMETPGVEVRPIRQATGHAEFSEIFLTDVRVPVRNLIGPENQGWMVAQSTLAAERGVLAFERAERQRRDVEAFLRRELDAGAAWTRCGRSRAEFIGLLADLQAVRRLIRRLLRAGPQDPATAGLPAIIKLMSTTLAQSYADFQVRVAGVDGQIHRPALPIGGDVPMHDYILSFGDTISAGSNEIMRNLIAERGLGLPRR
jgi:alkylation response protein AidB-like acyl-CoA dehydrogenase